MISVVVPVFNGEPYLADCLSSVAGAVESLTPELRSLVEVIVCDNWSTDATDTIARGMSLSCSYRVVRPPEHCPNRTQNWHHGLSLASGEWMMMLHADDLMSKGALSGQLEVCASRAAGRAVVLTGTHRTFSDNVAPSSLRPRWPFPALLDGGRLARTVLPLHCPFVPFTLMRRSAYEKVGGLDDRWELVQDWELWMRLAGLGDVLYHRHEVGMWRLHDVSGHYREVCAREHVALSRTLDGSVQGLSGRVRRRAQRIQQARAGHYLGIDASDEGNRPLQDGSRAAKRQARLLRRATLAVAARLYVLRLVGTLQLRFSPRPES